MRAAILIINLIIAYVFLSGWPGSLPMWLRAVLALIVVMLAVPLSDASSKSKNRPKLRSLRAPKWLDYLYIGGVVFCIELLLLAVFTLGPATAEEVHEDFKYWIMHREQPAEVMREAPGELSHDGAGNWLWDNHFKRSHPKQASKRPSNKPEILMEVVNQFSQTSLRRHRIYLRTFALDHFDGDTWSIYQPTKLIIDRPVDSSIQISPVNGTWRSLLPLYDHTIIQPYYANGQNLLTSIQNTIDTNVTSLTKVNTDTYILPRLNKETYRYRARSQPMLLDKISELDDNLLVGETHSVYLSRVSNARLQSKLTEFVSGVDQSLSLVEQLAALKKLINIQCSYSLIIENKGGMNALENFLFEEKSGYCEFYASAGAMLCRELGIPSRIAFGWSGGKFFQDSDLFVFRSEDAHAWTEVYLEGYGWVIYDTTPPDENTVEESEEDEVPPDLSEMTDDSGDYLLDEDSSDMMITWVKVLITIGSLIGIIFVLLFIRKLTQPKENFISAAYIKSEPKYLQLFQKLSARLGYSIRPGQTLLQSVQDLKAQDMDVSGVKGLLDRILAYHYDTTYRNIALDRMVENEIISELKRVMKSIEG